MSAHGPIRDRRGFSRRWRFCFSAAATGLGVSFTPSPGGLVFAAVLLIILFALYLPPCTMPR